MQSIGDGKKHTIEITRRNSLLKFFLPSRFSGDNFMAHQHFKKVQSKFGER